MVKLYFYILVFIFSNLLYSQEPVWKKISGIKNIPITSIETNNSGYIFASTNKNCIYVSKNDGFDWDIISLNLPEDLYFIKIVSAGNIF